MHDEEEPLQVSPPHQKEMPHLTKQQEYQNAQVDEFFKEIERREATSETTMMESVASKSSVRFEDPRKRYLTAVAPRCTLEEKERLLGKGRQVTRYPVFKDVKKLWTYNYAAEEAKRFKG